jgi:integrase
MARYDGVTKREDGRWQKCRTIEGKRRYFYGRTPQEALDKANEAAHLAKRGRIVMSTRQTVEQFLQEWLAGIQPRVRENTHENYGAHIRRALRAMPELGAMRLIKVSPRHLQACYAELSEQKYAARTIRATHAVLREAFEQAVDWDILARNPARKVRLPKIEDEPMGTLSAEQVRSLVEGTGGTKWHAYFAVMCGTGLRVAEQAGLLWSDLDEEALTIKVERQVVRRKAEGLIFAPLKSRKSRRVVPISPGILRALKAHRAIQSEQRLKKGPAWHKGNLIFPSGTGRPQHPRDMRDQFHAVLASLGLPRITPHQLRHTFATLEAERNVHPSKLQATLGHASAGTTLDNYTHVTLAMQRELADVMEHVMFGA